MKKYNTSQRTDILTLIYYIFSFIVTIISIIYSYSGGNQKIILFIFWILFGSCLAVFQFIWDVKKDWQLFKSKSEEKKHIFLRNQLSIAPVFYYIFIVMNIIFRFNYVIIISPGMYHEIFKQKKDITIYVCIIEMMRRCVWNFMRMEKEHFENIGLFKHAGEIKLPFQYIQMKNEDILLQNEHTSFAQQKQKKKPIFTNNQHNTDSFLYENYQEKFHNEQNGISEHSDIDESQLSMSQKIQSDIRSNENDDQSLRNQQSQGKNPFDNYSMSVEYMEQKDDIEKENLTINSGLQSQLSRKQSDLKNPYKQKVTHRRGQSYQESNLQIVNQISKVKKKVSVGHDDDLKESEFYNLDEDQIEKNKQEFINLRDQSRNSLDQIKYQIKSFKDKKYQSQFDK